MRRVLLPFILLALTPLVLAAPDDNWGDQFLRPGDDLWLSFGTLWYHMSPPSSTQATLEDAVVYDGELIVAGSVDGYVDGLSTGQVAGVLRWDGDAWQMLGTGLNGPAFALAVWNGDLYVGGYFDDAGGVATSRIARWDGSSWHAVPGTPTGSIFDLMVYEGDLVACGGFSTMGGVPALGVARWNGVTWSAFGAGVANFGVTDLAEYDGDLYAGGYFEIANGAIADRLAAWDGSSWSPVPTPPDGEIHDLHPWNGMLLVGGDFTGFLGAPGTANRVATYDGLSWSTLGDGFDDIVRGFVDDGSRLVALGVFSGSGGVETQGVAEWTGTSWRRIGNGAYDRYGGLFRDGLLHTVGRQRAEVWANPDFADPLTWGMEDQVRRMTVHDGTLIVSGDFFFWGDETFQHFTRFTGSGWEALPGGGIGPYVNSRVYAVESWNGLLLASVSSAGAVQSWNGAQWSSMDAGLPPNTQVADFQEYQGTLWAGLTAVGAPPRFLWYWTGSQWDTLPGPGLTGSVTALGVYDGELYASGTFNLAGGVVVRGITAFNGTSFRKMGAGLQLGEAYAFQEYGGELFVGGTFASAGPIVVAGLAAWDGTSWKSYGSPDNTGNGTPAEVLAMTVHQGDLVVGGRFLGIQGPAENIARWNGTAWSGLGSGLAAYGSSQHPVSSLVSHGGALWVGGDLRYAGGKLSFYLARWTEAVTAIPDDPRTVARLPLAVPNPFRSATRMELDLATRMRVEAAVYDVRGRRVRSLVEEPLGPGTALVAWDGRDDTGAPSPAGVYFLRVTRDGDAATRRIVRLP